MKCRLGALVLAMLTLTACAEFISSLERVGSWTTAQIKAKSPAASPTASSTVPSAVSSVVKNKSNRTLAKPPRRKPDPDQRYLAKPMRKPTPKTAVAKTSVPKTAVPKTAKPKTAVAKTAAASTLSPDPKLLLGLDFSSTQAILGAPEMQYEQPPAKVWTYRGGACMFSVFFFPNLNDSVFRVLTFEASSGDRVPKSKDSDSKSNTQTSNDGAKKFARRCFAELIVHQAAHNEG